jgi:multidrug efflux pump subunit AcrB/ABC-type multidrug transport system ATPase subunit
MNIIRFIINHKVFTGMCFVGITMLGYFSLRELPMEITPNSELSYLIVNVRSSTEMDPQYVEQEGVIPVESAVSRLEGIDQVETTISQTGGTITVTFNPDVQMKYAYVKLEAAVNAVRAQLPTEFTVSLARSNTTSLTTTFMQLQIRGEGGLDRIRAIIDKDITKELTAVSGIASVNITGGRTKSVEVHLDTQACKGYNITPATIRSAITSGNQSKTYIGEAHDNGKRYFVTLVSDYTNIEDLQNIVVRTTGPVYLRDVATVTFGATEETSISRINGMESITIQLTRDAQANLIDLAHSVRNLVAQLNKDFASQGIEIVIQTDTALDMENNIKNIEELALMGALLAVAVLWLFLRNMKLVMVIVLAIPISVLAAFNFFYSFGVSINTLTLVGIALAVGMLLDNGVVVLENTMRLLSLKRDRDTAVIQGTTEVWRAILASTFTTCIVFLPFVFSSDATFRLIGHHVGTSIISTLTVSLFVGLFLTPMLVHAILGRKTDLSSGAFVKVSFKNRIVQLYTLFLKTAMRYPDRAVVGATIAFFLTISLSTALSMNVAREVELKQFSLYLTPPPGSTLDSCDAITKVLEDRLNDIKEKQDLITRVYEDESTVTVVLKDDYEKISKRSIAQIKTDIQRRIQNFPGAQVSLSQPQSSTRYGSSGVATSLPIEQAFGIGSQSESIVLRGNDIDVLRTVGEDIQSYMQQLDTVTSVSFNVGSQRPEVHLNFDRLTMSKENIPLNAVSSAISAFGSQVSTSVPFTQGTDQYTITILSEEPGQTADQAQQQQMTGADLRELPVTASSGAIWGLEQLASIVFTRGRSSIHRLNQEKQLVITYQFNSDINQSKTVLQTARDDVDEIISNISIPPGVAVQVIHEETNTNEFGFLIGAAFTVIYMILAAVFESLTAPFVMMFTIPLAAIGALWALVLTNNSLMTASALIGLLVLLGVVVNNGILLIDYTRILRRRGYGRSRALMSAVRARVRPILITSGVTIVGMIPLAMGTSEYVGMIGAPFAITVIGGLGLSSLFTLVYIPTIYSGLESGFDWIRSLDWWSKGVQIALIAVLLYFINTSADGMLWKCIYGTVAVVMVPSMFWFMTMSLRQAKAEYIGRDEKLFVSIRRMVKIYDDDSRFVREWKKGDRIAGPGGMPVNISHLIWQLPVLAFMVFFTYFYMNSHTWMFLFSILVFFYVLFLGKEIGKYLVTDIGPRFPKAKSFGEEIEKFIIWVFPAANMYAFDVHSFRLAVIGLIGGLWYLLLLMRFGADRYHRLGINIVRMTGRFVKIRQMFYTIVSSIPVIGKKKRPFRALDSVSFNITSGMFGLLGPNGAGKTTIMRIFCGILNQTMGSMTINGVNFREKREELQGLIGYLPQEFGTYENMTAREFLDYIAILKRVYDRDQRHKIVSTVLTQVHLRDNMDQKIGSFSGGMKQRVGIAMTLLHLPRVLVVDEPTAGLDPRERIRFRNLLVELSKERIVIFSTHIIEDISSSCNNLVVMNRGNLYYEGHPREMTDTVKDKVWQVLVSETEFETARSSLRIVHHMRVGDQIRIRCLSETKPRPDAELVVPTLEDAYLWLLRVQHATAAGFVNADKKDEEDEEETVE